MSSPTVDHAKLAGICIDLNWSMTDLVDALMGYGITLAPDDILEIRKAKTYLREQISSVEYNFGVVDSI